MVCHALSPKVFRSSPSTFWNASREHGCPSVVFGWRSIRKPKRVVNVPEKKTVAVSGPLSRNPYKNPINNGKFTLSTGRFHYWYCWWFWNPVNCTSWGNGSWNLPLFTRFLFSPSQVVGNGISEPSTILFGNNMKLEKKIIAGCFFWWKCVKTWGSYGWISLLLFHTFSY